MYKFKPGNLVYWCETYADGDISKDMGMGVIVAIKDYPDLNYHNYLVFRNKHKDTMIFETHNLDFYSISKGEKNGK